MNEKCLFVATLGVVNLRMSFFFCPCEPFLVEENLRVDHSVLIYCGIIVLITV